MTYREKLMQEHPEYVSEQWKGGCYNCPCDYGYEESEDCPNTEPDIDIACRACWDREMED